MVVKTAHVCNTSNYNISPIERIRHLLNMPEPFILERPTEFADRIGQWYSMNVSAAHKKKFGQYLTPVVVSDFMAGLLTPKKDTVRMIDPGAGAGILACAACEFLCTQKTKPTQIILDVYETDNMLLDVLKKALSHLYEYLKNNGVCLKFSIYSDDFILKYAHFLSKTPTLFQENKDDIFFDICISNPPYFKLSKTDIRATAASEVVHGQPNIYALFMAVGASVLLDKGEFVFITPRSFTSGPYFQLFRNRFFETMRPEFIHIFDSRRETFKRDKVLQENIILKARRDDNWQTANTNPTVIISESINSQDMQYTHSKKFPISTVIDKGTREKILKIHPRNGKSTMLEKIDSLDSTLHEYGLEISTGPVVPFRAKKYISEKESNDNHYAPLFWLQNVQPMQAIWPVATRQKPQYIAISDDSRKLLVPVGNYVLLRRFSAKEETRRLTAAPLIASKTQFKWIGLENHLNYIYRVGGNLSEEEAWGLAVLYNSSFYNEYFRTLNGSTQVSATEIRTIALPPLSIICEIGKRAMEFTNILDNIDSLACLAFQED
jgi:adenine-specific DNA-methyltransferase